MHDDRNQNRESEQLILAIKEEQIVVAPESKIKLHVAVINQSADDDYVDILVKGVPSEWTTIDNPVVHLHAGETKQVMLTVEAPPLPQGRVGQYPLDVYAVSQSDPTQEAVASSILTVAAYQSKGRIGIMLGSVHFSISPGSSIHIPILLQNRGLNEDSFQLSVKGIPASWVSTNSTLTRLEPSSSKEIRLSIRVPHSPEAEAGRTPIKIQFVSQDYPDQQTEVECILTISAFSKFSVTLQPETLRAGQIGQLIVNNEGNTVDTYSLSFSSPGNDLIFEKGVPASRSVSQAGSQGVEVKYVEIPHGERFRVKAGERGIYGFRSRLRSRRLVGNEQSYPYSVKVLSSENKSIELPGDVNESGLIPTWLVSAGVIGILLLCLVILVPPFFSSRTAARATQTAIFNQTQAALSGQDDTDGDGLINNDEILIGTDPITPDSDSDGLLDGDEVNTYLTNPLLPDTDEDGLLDGEEIVTHKTDPLNPDTDADTLSDGEEINLSTVPVDPDTDRDGLSDGDEIRLGTDPRQQDSDRDGLLDGQENQTCPLLLEPDSDNDGIIDGIDLNPCDSNNPSMTLTALASIPTSVTPGVTVIPTAIPSGTPVPTNPAVATPTLILPGLQGTVLFESNRDGNTEIYALELTNQTLLRVTDNPAVDTQPVLSPDGTSIAYVSNQTGNNEIYITGLDRRTPVNITNNPADDQQPTWSPDGNWIAFTTNRDGNQAIYIMRSDGTELRSLTGNLDSNFSPAWFSINRLLGSDEWIAFTSTRDGNQEIYRIRPDGTGLENLTQNPANDHSPAGTFGGLLLTFVSDRGGNPDIYTMTNTGGGTNNITNSFSQDLDPNLSPDGDWITFASDRDGNMEVYVVDANGGNVFDLTRNPALDRNPDW